MGVAELSGQEAAVRAIAGLGLDPASVGPQSEEAMAASLRRAASFMCPTTPGMLIRSVDETIMGLPGYDDDTKPQLEAVLDSLLSYGDLLELDADEAGLRQRRLFLAAPAFVRRVSGTCLLIGIRPEAAPLVGDELLARVEYKAHVRLIRSSTVGVAEQLAADGLSELTPEQWLASPRAASPDEVVKLYTARLETARPSGDIEGLRIIDPSAQVRYYRGRWRPTKSADTGHYVARRPQAYGADLWCFAEVTKGQATRLLDLPAGTLASPAADEAWRLQAAIDALNGHHQSVIVRGAERPHLSVVDFFSPVPSWMQRRLDIVGTPLARSRGALFSYTLLDHELPEELQFLWDMVWTRESPAQGTADGS